MTGGSETRAKLARVRRDLATIAQRPKQVTMQEIERVANALMDLGYSVRQRKARHGHIFTIDGKKFMVNDHNPGDTHVMSYSARQFLGVMADLGLLEEE